MGYMAAKAYMRLWMGVTLALGVIFFAGVLITVIELLSTRAEREFAS